MAALTKLCFMGHLLMEHRSALIVDMELTQADGYAERAAAVEMLRRLPACAKRRTVAADKAYDTKEFVADARELGFTPQVAQIMSGRRTAIDGRTTRHRGYQAAMRIKTIAGGRKLRYLGCDRNRAWFLLTGAGPAATRRAERPATSEKPVNKPARAVRSAPTNRISAPC